MKIKMFMKFTTAFGFSKAIKSEVCVNHDKISFRYSVRN